MSRTHTVAEGDRLKKDTSAGVSTWEGQVLSLARSLHARPELSFEETESAAAITALLAEGGLTVEHGTGGLPTAFTATAGSGNLTVALCVEYDALPEVGHACGHNLIAGASVAAALALAPYADELGITLKAIGTPAEEHGGGKSLLLEAGAFDGVGLALMVHPVQDGVSYNPAGTTAQAVGRYRAVFSGRAAHAAAAPHQGVNAADGATIAQVAIGLLRQQIPGDHRVALFVSEAGVATNIIPERAVVDFECRAFTLPEYEALLARVRRCFEGAALASGTEVVIEATEPLYEPLVQDDALAGYWTAAMESFGRDTTSGGRLRRRVDRHGQCQSGHPESAPLAEHPRGRSAHPLPRVHRGRRHRRGVRADARGGPRARLDRRRRGGRSRAACPVRGRRLPP